MQTGMNRPCTQTSCSVNGARDLIVAHVIVDAHFVQHGFAGATDGDQARHVDTDFVHHGFTEATEAVIGLCVGAPFDGMIKRNME